MFEITNLNSNFAFKKGHISKANRKLIGAYYGDNFEINLVFQSLDDIYDVRTLCLKEGEYAIKGQINQEWILDYLEKLEGERFHETIAYQTYNCSEAADNYV